MNIVILSDFGLEHQAKNFIESLILQKIKPKNLFYYTINFDSELDYDFLRKIKWELDSELPFFPFYKSAICLDSLKRSEGVFYYFDTDVLISKRFKDFKPITGNEYPILSFGPYQYPNRNWYYSDGREDVYNERKFQEFLNISERTMPYAYSCFFTYDIMCEDFFKEVDSWCRFKYFVPTKSLEEQKIKLNRPITYYDRRVLEIYPLMDETIFNVILWRRKATINYGHIFCNTANFQTVKEVEWDDTIKYKEFKLGYHESVRDSKNIIFYHGIKSNKEAKKILGYAKKCRLIIKVGYNLRFLNSI